MNKFGKTFSVCATALMLLGIGGTTLSVNAKHYNHKRINRKITRKHINKYQYKRNYQLYKRLNKYIKNDKKRLMKLKRPLKRYRHGHIAKNLRKHKRAILKDIRYNKRITNRLCKKYKFNYKVSRRKSIKKISRKRRYKPSKRKSHKTSAVTQTISYESLPSGSARSSSVKSQTSAIHKNSVSINSQNSSSIAPQTSTSSQIFSSMDSQDSSSESQILPSSDNNSVESSTQSFSSKAESSENQSNSLADSASDSVDMYGHTYSYNQSNAELTINSAKSKYANNPNATPEIMSQFASSEEYDQHHVAQAIDDLVTPDGWLDSAVDNHKWTEIAKSEANPQSLSNAAWKYINALGSEYNDAHNTVTTKPELASALGHPYSIDEPGPTPSQQQLQQWYNEHNINQPTENNNAYFWYTRNDNESTPTGYRNSQQTFNHLGKLISLNDGDLANDGNSQLNDQYDQPIGGGGPTTTGAAANAAFDNDIDNNNIDGAAAIDDD